MQIRTSKELQLHRDNLVQQLRQLNLEILHQYHNLQQLGDPDSAELQEDLNHQNDNIARTKQ